MAEVTDDVRQRMAELGSEGERWLGTLDERIAALEALWGCRIEEPIGGGSAAFVAAAVDRVGRPAVVKISIPAGGVGYTGFERELDVLTLAGSRAYVAVYEHDANHRALLLERLGPPLADLGLGVSQQIDQLAPTIATVWTTLGSRGTALRLLGTTPIDFSTLQRRIQWSVVP